MFNRILVLQHKGGEYLSINISSLDLNKELIWHTIEDAERQLKRPSTTSNVALQVLDTKLTTNEVEKIVFWLNKMKKDIQRLAIIGVNFRGKSIFKKAFKKAKSELNYKFIFDWDTAKDWFVGKIRV